MEAIGKGFMKKTGIEEGCCVDRPLLRVTTQITISRGRSGPKQEVRMRVGRRCVVCSAHAALFFACILEGEMRGDSNRTAGAPEGLREEQPSEQTPGEAEACHVGEDLR